MDLNSDFDRRQIQRTALQAYEKQLEQQLSEISLFKTLKRVQEMLAELDGPEVIKEVKKEEPSQISTVSRKYFTGWSLSKKAIYVLSEADRGMTTAEVVDSIIKIEPSLKPNRVRIVANLSGVLGAKAKKEGSMIIREMNQNDEFVYYWIEKRSKAKVVAAPESIVPMIIDFTT